jgi:hypothetical protein
MALNMSNLLSADEITALGFEWPKNSTIKTYAAVENGKVNVDKSLYNMRIDRAYYKNHCCI